ncbi:MAG TPA: GTP 3',8-cyclase MoaA [Syntrophomonadaceae bacterium]|nr:GTP 3',8-cyclase MoaA [Syntrophomonadaceae bacterium]HNX29837.1 GTP 3',8-cyclase MoaA [Syntrophomonadaceae bacterium]HPR92926.1 GTP 3',8-cyclase MoaA [Syntrophomonadaceae bacterium]
MTDKFDREINYLRISVTDRCNLRCRYCMPEEGIDDKLSHQNILSLEDYARIVRTSTRAGIRKVRLTGGEPLVRKNLVQLVRYISETPWIDDIAITTNGILFPGLAQQLKEAGLNRINISLDSLKEERFKYITRLGNLSQVKTAVFKALELGLNPVKINTVVIKGFNDDEIIDFAKLAHDFPLHVRFIEFMPIGDLLFWRKDRLMKADAIKSVIEKRYDLENARNIQGNGPARYFKTIGGQGSLGFISPMSNHFCAQCNRIRMTADGMLRGCLYEKNEIDLKPALLKTDDEEILRLINKTIDNKPARHNMNDGWGKENERKMYQIGG